VRFTLVEELTPDLEESLWRLYQAEEWSKGCSLGDVQKMLGGNTLNLALVDEEGFLAGYTRVLSDGAFTAFLMDAIVAPAWRGAGLGRRLMDAALGHPDIRGVRQFQLYCTEELVPFYEQWGFTSDIGDLCFMRRR
jgi:predicted GNAT family N-acyltransferase